MTRHVCAADLGLRSDGTGAVVLRVDDVRSGEGARRTHLTLVAHYERKPKPGAPLSPSIVCSDIAAIATRHGCREVWADMFYVEAFREELGKRRLGLREAPGGVTGKAEVWSTCRARILEGHVSVPSVPNLPALLSQLKVVRSRPTPGGGISIEQPRKGGSHGDLAAAFALAVWAATAARAGHIDLGAYTSRSGAVAQALARLTPWVDRVAAPTSDLIASEEDEPDRQKVIARS